METQVVLDANAYRETNYGRSGKFTSLVDFLRKSNSQLVLLPSVLEEVLSKQERDLKEHLETAKRSVELARKLCFSGKLPSLRNLDPDFETEAKALKHSLLEVGKGVPVNHAEDLGVDVLEVVRRGARRIPPASPNGEELRDVIHWLCIVSYAKRSAARILFVSRDRGFWIKGGGPKAEILGDIKDSGQRIELFRDIDDLLKENSLSSAPLDPGRVTELFDIPQIESQIIEMVGDRIDGVETEDSIVEFKSGKIESSDFQSGVVYQVGKDSEYVEATFLMKIDTQIEFRSRLARTWSQIGEGLGASMPLSGLSGIRRPPVSFDVTASVYLSTRVIDRQVGTPEVERVSLSD
jgi:hypothetical protein